MFKNDSGAIGINAHRAVEVFEVSSDVRRYRIFPLVGTGTVSTLPNSPILLDFTPSETKDPRPIAGAQTSTVTYYTADRLTVTKYDTLTIGVSPPSSMTPLSALRHSAFQMTEHTATKLNTTVGVTQSSEFTATHHLVLYMLLTTITATTTGRPTATKFNDPRFFPHYSHPPYNGSMQHY